VFYGNLLQISLCFVFVQYFGQCKLNLNVHHNIVLFSEYLFIFVLE